jgi:hypothetical protein
MNTAIATVVRGTFDGSTRTSSLVALLYSSLPNHLTLLVQRQWIDNWNPKHFPPHLKPQLACFYQSSLLCQVFCQGCSSFLYPSPLSGSTCGLISTLIIRSYSPHRKKKLDSASDNPAPNLELLKAYRWSLCVSDSTAESLLSGEGNYIMCV